jgi:hypothetical protein
MVATLRDQLVEIALEWERRYGVAPHITSAISEYDAALLVKCPESDYCQQMQGKTAVSKGYDFTFGNSRYQVKANRPSGKPGSFVTLVAKASNYDWDYSIWILYDKHFVIQEAWLWDVNNYRIQFHEKKRLSPADMRHGTRLV